MRILIAEATTLQVINRAGLNIVEFEQWEVFVRRELSELRVHPEGLGAWSIGPANSRTPDAGYSKFLQETGPAAASPFRVELVEPPPDPELASGQPGKLGSLDSVNPDLLGSYNANACYVASGGPTTKVSDEAVIELYVSRIQHCAKRYAQGDPWPLASIVLRHELGHHIARTTPEERRLRVYSNNNPEACRPEAAAQLFAWLTGDDASRQLMKHLHGNGPGNSDNAYTVYLHFVDFAMGKCNREIDTAASLRPGWMLSWQLVQHPKKVSLSISRSLVDSESAGDQAPHSLQTQIHGLASKIDAHGPSTWPILAALGQDFDELAAGDKPGKIVFNSPLQGGVNVDKIQKQICKKIDSAVRDSKIGDFSRGGPLLRLWIEDFLEVWFLDSIREVDLAVTQFQAKLNRSDSAPLAIV